jgi:transcriptional regulator with XRE-family HTH domain
MTCKRISRMLALFLQRWHGRFMAMTPAQCRAGRALLPMTQAELAAASGVSLRTIAHFEAGERQPIPANLAALQRALEAAGVEFIPENGEGAGVRLRKPREPS